MWAGIGVRDLVLCVILSALTALLSTISLSAVCVLVPAITLAGESTLVSAIISLSEPIDLGVTYLQRLALFSGASRSK